MNIEDELKLVGLTPESYESFLQECSDKINGVSDVEWGEIIEKYNLPYDRRRLSESMGRNILGGNFVREYYKKQIINKAPNEALKELLAKEQEIYKAKRKLQDERNELNKILRDEARYEENVRLLEEQIQKIGAERYNHFLHNCVKTDTENTCFISLSDLHIGLNYSSITGEYNIDIAKKRLQQYLLEIKAIASRHSISKCVVGLLGDEISGNIHLTLQISNRENVVEQLKTACELISDFIYELRQIFGEVKVYSVPGNHSRLEKNKDDSLLGEKLDNIIPWFLKHIYSADANIFVEDLNVDDTYTNFEINGKNYVIVHGDVDGINDIAIQRLCSYLGFFPYAVIMGHKHHIAMNEVSGVKVIQSGSLCGSGDDYCIKNRLKGKASQTVLVCNNKGIEAIYPVEFE